MKETLGYQVDELAAALKMPLSFDPTTLIEIAVYNVHRFIRRWKFAVITVSLLCEQDNKGNN